MANANLCLQLTAVLLILLGNDAASKVIAQDPLPKANKKFMHREGQIVALPGIDLLESVGGHGYLSKDGRHLFAVLEGHPVIVYDLQQMKEIKRIGGNHTWAPFLADVILSYDESKLALSKSDFGPVQIYDISTGKMINEFNAIMRPTGLAFSASGDRIYMATFDGEIRCWDLKTERLVFQVDTGGKSMDSLHYRVLASTRDGKSIVAAGASGFLRLLDPETGKETHKLDVKPVEGHDFNHFSNITIAVNDRDVFLHAPQTASHLGFLQLRVGIWHLDLSDATTKQVVDIGSGGRIHGKPAVSPKGSHILYTNDYRRSNGFNPSHSLSSVSLKGGRAKSGFVKVDTPIIVAASLAGDRVLLMGRNKLVQWGLPKK